MTFIDCTFEADTSICWRGRKAGRPEEEVEDDCEAGGIKTQEVGAVDAPSIQEDEGQRES